MSPEEFRAYGHRLVDWIAEYLAHPERYPVLSKVRPGEIATQLGETWDGASVGFDRILADFERTIVAGVTHWNHPAFFAYFAISASGPGILADFLSSALNQQGMLWRTSPALTEVEDVSLRWLRDLIGLSPDFEGVIYDTASISTLHALAAAREAGVEGVRRHGLTHASVRPLRIYASDQAHSSVDKAVILLGLGHDALRSIPTDAEFRMIPTALDAAVREDRAGGLLPLAVVATVGTTSSTSVDPVPAIADICEREQLWLHVDAAYAGVAAMVPGWEWTLAGARRAHSVVVNPHKWLFTPFDLSALYCRRMDVLRAAFSLVPEYLRTPEAGRVRNLMDTGIQLGRRFRALKLWMILRYFGRAGLVTLIAEHIRLAREFAAWVDADPDFERLAPVPFSVVCFRARPRGWPDDDASLDRLNAELLDAVNTTGQVFLSHTKLAGRYTLRMAIGNIHTREIHVASAWNLLKHHCDRLARGRGAATPPPPTARSEP
jgi:aromatic-L-amino-acid decarboxylase